MAPESRTMESAETVAGRRARLAAGAGLAMLLAGIYLAPWPPAATIFDVACYTRGWPILREYPLHTLLCWPLGTACRSPMPS